MELFAGRAMLSEAVRGSKGLDVLAPSDLYTADEADLRDKTVLARVVDRLERDVFWVHMAPPCRTFSRARKRAKVLRSAVRPEGDGNDPDLAEANELAAITFAVAERAVHCGAFFSVENPLSSLMWRLPAAVRVAGMRGVQLLEFEQCAFGGQHRKATGVLTNGGWLPAPRCKHAPPHNHVTLRGRIWSYKDKREVWYTAEAAEYPWAMCAAWAAAASKAAADDATPILAAQVGPPVGGPQRIVNGVPPSDAQEARRAEDAACYGGLRDPHRVVELAPGWQAVGKLLAAIIDRVLLSHGEVLRLVAALADPHRDVGRIREVVVAAASEVQEQAAEVFGAKAVRPARGGYYADLVRCITSRAADPDTDVSEWMSGRTPLGVHAAVQPRGVFPEALPGSAALAAKEFYELNLRKGWKHSKNASFEEHRVGRAGRSPQVDGGRLPRAHWAGVVRSRGKMAGCGMHEACVPRPHRRCRQTKSQAHHGHEALRGKRHREGLRAYRPAEARGRRASHAAHHRRRLTRRAHEVRFRRRVPLPWFIRRGEGHGHRHGRRGLLFVPRGALWVRPSRRYLGARGSVAHEVRAGVHLWP